MTDETIHQLEKAREDNERLTAALIWIAHRCPKVHETSLDDPHRAHVEAAVDAGNCARAALPPSVGEPEKVCSTCEHEGKQRQPCLACVVTLNDDQTEKPPSYWQPKASPTDDNLPGPLSGAALGK